MSSSQCLSHPWLKRSPPAPSSPTPTPRILQEELDVTKDNLRSFVERWNEHPDSPYVFDKACHSICPLPPPSSSLLFPLSSASHHSLHGMSPSPCGSLSSASSSPESVLEADTRLPPQTKDDPYYYCHYSIEGNPPPPWYVDRLLQERRASDSTCVVTRKHAGELSRVNLVDEIRKLSDRLFQMASRHNAASDNASKDLSRQLENEAGGKRASSEDVTLDSEEGDASQMRKSTFLAGPLRAEATAEEDVYRRPKFKITPLARDVPLTPVSTTETASTRTEHHSSTSTSSVVDRSFGRVSATHSLRWGLPVSGQSTYARTFSRTSSAASSCSSASSRESATFPVGCPSSSSSSSCHSAPQSPTRTPRGIASSPDMKADLTEDLIAHLLDGNGWEKRCESGSETKKEGVGGRKAMSMEWSRVDVTMESLGRRTMASLRQYFQEADATTESATEKDNILGRGERQTLARNISQLGV